MENRKLLKALKRLVDQNKGITFIGSKEEYISYKQLWNECGVLCSYLKKMGVHTGDEVAIYCKDNKNFIYSLWACIMGGFIAVPVDTGNSDYHTEVNSKIFNLLKEPTLLYDKVNKEVLDSACFDDRLVDVSAFDFNQTNSEKTEPDNSEQDILYIQFSSGSTETPKGVIIKDSNVMANAYDIIERLDMNEEDISLSWQPLTHCYGLIVFHIVPIVLGIEQYLMSSELFMKSPLLWIDKVVEHHVTRIGTIPFALKHFLGFYKCSEQSKNWDLSSVRSITVGGELVIKELCNEFIRVMEQYSLSQNVIVPIYGLSESTTGLSLLAPNTPLKSYKISRNSFDIGQKIVLLEDNENQNISYLGQGKPLKTIEIQITDDENNVLPEETIGHICARGDNIASGYYLDEESTKKVFLEDGWFDTGDLGFLQNGVIVVIGREKELLVVNGMKYMSIDIETIIRNKVEQCKKYDVVVCNGVDFQNKSEQANVFINISVNFNSTNEIKEFLELSRNIREVVYQVTGLQIDHVIPIEKIPKTFSGKIKRKELTRRFNEGDFIKEVQILQTFNDAKRTVLQGGKISIEKIRDGILDTILNMFQIKVDDYNLAFKNYGIVSINIPPFIEKINEMFEINVQVSSFFSHPSINQFSNYIYKMIHKNSIRKEEKLVENIVNTVDDKVAIIGMSCRFPGGANTIEEYWNVLKSGIDGIIDVPNERWDWEKYYDINDNTPGKMYCKKGGFLQTSVDEFDARFFNISPKEAMSLDPQQRLMLELTWEAFEYANLDITKYKGSNTGVYLGMSTTEYMLANLYSGDLSRIDAYTLTGTCMSTACGRISYTFGFQGPCITVDTACSSALTAVHLACNAIKMGEADCCVVGGVNLMASPAINVGFSKLHATAKDGHSKAFDASADGYGRSEGGGVIILKKLSEAKKDGDHILGVICNSGINQDGKSNGLTAPNGEAQTKLIRETLQKAHLQPSDIDYIEMHGTGTKLGDPIEVNAIVDAFEGVKTKENPLMIGSVKSNIGHLEAASGIASIIKILLSMKNHLIPANLNFNNPNPFIDWENSPVKVISKHTPWVKENGIRRAGISAFGFGGSNAHAIIEEYNEDTIEVETEKEGLDYILKVSAKNETSLRKYAENYLETLKDNKNMKLCDFIYSAARGRADFDYRLCMVGKTKEEFIEKLEAYIKGDLQHGVFTNLGKERNYIKNRKVIFMFTGQGSQYVNMGRILYESESVFKNAMEECNRLFKPYILKSITELLYGENMSADVIQKTLYAQPLIFAIEYSLSKLLEHYEIKPEIVMGHSIGEYAAAVQAGIISLQDAAQLVSIRGRLMDSAPGSGAMATIFASEDKVCKMMENYSDVVSIAALNARDTCVISGDSKSVEEILSLAEGNSIRVSRLKVSHGFHSQLMEPVLEDYRAIAEECSYSKPKVRFVSALYAKEIDENQVLDSEYWTKHIREKVDFYHSLLSIENLSDYVLLEVGAHTVLTGLCKLIFGEETVSVGTLNRKKEDSNHLSETLAILYTAGVNLNWSKISFMGIKKWNRIQLPKYPFDKSKYWMDLVYDRKENVSVDVGDVHRFLGQKIDSPAMDNGVIYQTKYSREIPFFMSEHIIFNTSIAPAASYVSMLISAMKDLKNPASCTIRHIDLREPLAITSDEERLVQVCIKDITEKECEYSIVSRPLDDMKKKWSVHTQGLISSEYEFKEIEDEINLEEVKNLDFDFDAEGGIYSSMHNAGFDLGDSFRRIVKTNVKVGHGISYIEPLENVPDLDMYEVYPGVIDSIFQTMLCVVFEEFDSDENNRKGNRTTIPYYFDSITYNYKEYKNLWCRVDASMENDIISGDIDIFNEKGEMLMLIRGFMTKLTNRENLLKGLKNSNSGFYYHTAWIEKKAEHKDLIKSAERYVLVTEKTEIREKIVSLFEAEKMKYNLVIPDASYFIDETGKYHLKVSEKKNWSMFLDEITDEKDGKIYFIYSVVDNCIQGIVNFMQAIIEAGFENKCQIKVLTQNVQDVGSVEKLNLEQAPLWGMLKVISLEYPNVFAGVLDIDNDCFESNGKEVLDELISTVDKEVCLRVDGKRYVSILESNVDYKLKHKEKVDEIKIKQDASYLITGGTGALGLVYAQCLINKGAKNLILVARHEPSEAVKSKIEQFIKMGICIEIMYADVCDEESIRRAINTMEVKMPVIRGVIHAAGTLCDKMLSEQTWEDFITVLNPKVEGSKNLYKILKRDNIDFFIMLSSITSIIGNVGQSNYAAANYFMNQFAIQMQKEGVHGYTFCWGPWEESGMASNNDVIARNMENMGIRAFSKGIGTQIIEEFIERPYTNLIAVDIDWNRYAESFAGSVNRAFLSKLLREDKNKTENSFQEENSTVLNELASMPKEERKPILISILQKISGKVMGYSQGQFPDKDITFNEQGVDSLMIFSMRNTLNKMFHVDLNVSTFFNYPTIDKLADYLLTEELFKDKQTEEVEESTEGLLKRLEKLTD